MCRHLPGIVIEPPPPFLDRKLFVVNIIQTLVFVNQKGTHKPFFFRVSVCVKCNNGISLLSFFLKIGFCISESESNFTLSVSSEVEKVLN